LRKLIDPSKNLVAYTFRHAWMTDALERGALIASLVELTGHSDTMISKLLQKPQHLRGGRAGGGWSEPHRPVIRSRGGRKLRPLPILGELLLGDADAAATNPVPVAPQPPDGAKAPEES